MNQILITGDENITKKVKKQKKALPVSGIVVFYAICLIILGICMTCGFIYIKEKIKQKEEESIKPIITTERNYENNTIGINITHKRGIKTVAYRWNDEEETVIDCQNKQEVNEIIDVILGENVLKISVTEENGQLQSIERTFIVPILINLEGVENGVKVISTSVDEIDYVQYSWDDGEMQKIEVGEESYQGIINVPKGQHTLKIEVVDINEKTETKEKVVIGEVQQEQVGTKPTLNIQSKLINGKATFVIDAKDDENIKTISIIHNGGEEQFINVNEKTYSGEVIMTENEENTIIVTVTNTNGLQEKKGVRFSNK